MVLIYIISMAVAFSFYFGGDQVTFWYKYAIAAMWSISCFGFSVIKAGKIKGKDSFFIRTYVVPLLLICGWSMLIWLFHTPQPFTTGHFTRMLSNTIYLVLGVTSAISCTKIFGKDVIKYSVWAIALSVLANLIYSTSLYGIDMLLQYLPQAAGSTDFPYGSPLYNFAVCLEVQDATLATGFYILYFLFLDKDDDTKTKIQYMLLLLVSAYIGFKRTEMIAIILTAGIIWGIRQFRISEKNATRLIGFGFVCLSFAYIYVVKADVFQAIIDVVGANVTGRQNIYRILAGYYEFSPLYMGKGFTYVDKTMYDSIGFAAHNTIIKMFAELGFLGFCAWIYWYVIKIPISVANKFGREVALVTLMSTVYLFLTYCIGNSMNFYCIQYSFVLITISLAYADDEPTYHKKKIVFGRLGI